MKLKYFVPVLLCIVFISCGTSDSRTSTDTNDMALLNLKKNEEQNKAVSLTTTDTTGIANEDVFQNAPPVIEWDKKIIKTANIQAECKDYPLFNRKLHAMVKHYGGWVAAESEIQQPDKISNSVSIKVPVIQFEDMVNAMGSIDGKILSKAISTEDVTGQVVDAAGRVAVKKVMRDKYVGMLKQATKMEDVLNVESKIDDIHEAIEMSATRLEALKHQSSYSTININYYQPVETGVVVDETPGIGSRMLTAATNGAAWLGDLLIGAISIWPLLLIFFFLFYFIRRKMAQPVSVKTKNAAE